LTDQNLRDFKSQKAFLFLYGIITYKDIFKKPHWTSFCVYYKPPALDLEDCGGEAK
jgi:hypothetical protein